MNYITQILILPILLTGSGVRAATYSGHSFPMEDVPQNNYEEDVDNQVKPYEWYEQRTKWLMEKTLKNQQRYEKIERLHGWKNVQ